MKILAVNVNTTVSMTQTIAAAAQEVACAGTEIVGVTPTTGFSSVEGNLESYLAAIAITDAVVKYPGEFDAVIQAGFGEHGKESLMEVLEVPVVDMTEAAVHMAMLLGDCFSVVTTLDRTVPLIKDRLTTFGLMEHCVSIRSTGLSVLELENADLAREKIIEESREAIEKDRAEVIVLGCGGMAGLDKEISQTLRIPVVEGVAAAVKLAEGLVRLGLKTSKSRTYAFPIPKQAVNWPLP